MDLLTKGKEPGGGGVHGWYVKAKNNGKHRVNNLQGGLNRGSGMKVQNRLLV